MTFRSVDQGIQTHCNNFFSPSFGKVFLSILSDVISDLLAAFLEVENIKHQYKSRLVGSVLNGYLSLRKLVVQRTKMIDDTQDKLLELLEEMTTGIDGNLYVLMLCIFVLLSFLRFKIYGG